jgi:hypothetical protein
VFALRLAAGASGEFRRRLIDIYGAVVEELRGRGHEDVRAAVIRNDWAEFLVVALSSGGLSPSAR